MSVQQKYADVAVLTPKDIMTIMQWSKAHTYRVLEECMEDGAPFIVKKICGTIRISKSSFFDFLTAMELAA